MVDEKAKTRAAQPRPLQIICLVSHGPDLLGVPLCCVREELPSPGAKNIPSATRNQFERAPRSPFHAPNPKSEKHPLSPNSRRSASRADEKRADAQGC